MSIYGKVFRAVTLAAAVFICLVAIIGVCLGFIDAFGVHR